MPEEEKKSVLFLGGKEISLFPKNDQEYNELINACVLILANMVMVGTSNHKEDKKRAEAVLTMSGQLGGAVSKQALILIANSTLPPEAKKTEGEKGDA